MSQVTFGTHLDQKISLFIWHLNLICLPVFCLRLKLLKFGIYVYVNHTNLNNFQSSVRYVCQYSIRVNIGHFRQTAMISSNIFNCFKNLDYLFSYIWIKQRILVWFYNLYPLQFVMYFHVFLVILLWKKETFKFMLLRVTEISIFRYGYWFAYLFINIINTLKIIIKEDIQIIIFLLYSRLPIIGWNNAILLYGSLEKWITWQHAAMEVIPCSTPMKVDITLTVH